MKRTWLDDLMCANAVNTVVCNCRIKSIRKKGPFETSWLIEHHHLERSPTFWSKPAIQAGPYIWSRNPSERYFF